MLRWAFGQQPTCLLSVLLAEHVAICHINGTMRLYQVSDQAHRDVAAEWKVHTALKRFSQLQVQAPATQLVVTSPGRGDEDQTTSSYLFLQPEHPLLTSQLLARAATSVMHGHPVDVQSMQ